MNHLMTGTRLTLTDTLAQTDEAFHYIAITFDSSSDSTI